MSQYSGVKKIYKKYWSAYGGWGALIKSPYVHFSAILALVAHNYIESGEWADYALSIIPNFTPIS